MALNLDEVEFVDRYGPKGPPSLLVGCRGHCEATGWVPVYMDTGQPRSGLMTVGSEQDPELRRLWHEAEEKEPTDDGWHFVPCSDCGGTGRVKGLKRIGNIPHWLERKWNFARYHVLVWPYRQRQATEVLAKQERLAPEAFLVGSNVEIPRIPGAYGDRLDVPHPWWWNRKVAFKVLLGVRP